MHETPISLVLQNNLALIIEGTDPSRWIHGTITGIADAG